jgi:hypothetical protein
MSRKAFIFTMDAALALIPALIIMTTVTLVTPGESLKTQSWGLDGTRVANDALESMRITGDINSNDVVRISSLLNTYIPSRYNYSYEVYGPSGAQEFSVTRGTIGNAQNVYTAQKSATFALLTLEDYAYAVSHGGSQATAPFCQSGGNNIWELDFYYLPSRFDYYLLGKKVENMRVNWLITSIRQNCTPSLSGSITTKFMDTTDTFKRQALEEGQTYTGTNMTSGTRYYVYIRPLSKPTRLFDFFIVSSARTTPANLVTVDNIYYMERYIVRLRLWEEEG